MATRKPKTLNIEDVFPETPPQLPATVAQFPDNEAPQYDDVTALYNVLAELGEGESGGGFINIFRERTLPGGRKGDKEYIGKFDAAEFGGGGLLESIKSQHGPGTYEISVYHPGGNGLATRKKITIAADPVTAAPSAPVALDLTPVLTAINQNGEKTLQAILALAQGFQSKQPSRMETLQEMQMMAQMFKSDAPAAPNYNPIEMMKMGVEMAQMGGGGGDNNNAWVSKVIETFGGPMMDMIANAQAAKSAAPMTPRLPAAVPGAPALPVTDNVQPQHSPQPESEENVTMLIASYLTFLKAAAAKNAPIDEYADSILNTLPESEHAELEKFLIAPDWRESAKRHTGVIELYPQWFTSLRDTILQYIKEDREASAGSNPLTPSAIADIPVAHEDADTGFNGGHGGDPGHTA